jgi:hypothetical protein
VPSIAIDAAASIGDLLRGLLISAPERRDIVIRPSSQRSFVAPRSGRATVCRGVCVGHSVVIGRERCGPVGQTRKETPMFMQTQPFQVDTVGVFPALLLLLLMLLTALGIVAHVAFG